MRILVIGINYAPERTAVAPFTSGLCEHLASNGNEVTVVTAFPYYPEWRVWEGYRGSWYRKELIRGVEVRRVWHFVPNRASKLLQRLAHDLTFTVSAFIAGLFAGPFDVVYCCCPPPAVALSAYFLARIQRKPYILKLMDLASDAALATGILKEGLAVRVARAIEGFVYRQSEVVVCICHGFIEKLRARRIAPEKLRLIPLWAETSNVRPIAGANGFRRANRIAEESFLVVHTGNMGKKQGLINVLDAAELSREREDLDWLLVGEGEERAALEQETARRGLRNIRMLPLQPAERLAEMYAAADLLLLNQKAAVEEAVTPSKLLTYMAAGRPVLAAASEKSEGAKLLRRARCGWIVPAENPKALVEAALLLRQDAPLRRSLGENGRAFVLRNFTKQSVFREYDKLFREIAGSAHPDDAITKKAAVS